MGTPRMAATETLPFSPFEWMLASRYLRPRRKEGFISIIAIFSFLGIMLGVATLIAVMGVMNGFRAELYNKLLGLNGHVVVTKLGDPFTDYEQIARQIATVPTVTQVMPLIEGQALFANPDLPGTSTAVFVRGMRKKDIEQMNFVGGGLNSGTLNGFDESSTIVLGLRLANSLGVDVGGRVKLLTHRGQSTVFGIKPNSKIYTVAALIEVGMAEYDRSIAFLPLTEAQAFFNYPGQVNMLEVMIKDPEQVKIVGPEIQKSAGTSYLISDWQQRNATFFDVLDLERDMMFIIVSLIVLVAALNIVSGLMMLVKDKGKDIAILRTMGASQGAIMRVFLITGASIGVSGTIAGLVLGILFARNIEAARGFIQWVSGRVIYDPSVYLLTKLVARIDVWETGSIVLVGLVLSVLATLYPSWRASRLDPVQALRYE
jgi:lipoprotein-releasing system permease protein